MAEWGRHGAGPVVLWPVLRGAAPRPRLHTAAGRQPAVSQAAERCLDAAPPGIERTLINKQSKSLVMEQHASSQGCAVLIILKKKNCNRNLYK